MRSLIIPISIVLLLAGATSAVFGATPTEVRYTLAAGSPDTAFGNRGVECADLPAIPVTGGSIVSPEATVEIPETWTPRVVAGGVCFAVAPGTYTVDVVDDAGGAPGYWLSLSGDASGMFLAANYAGLLHPLLGAPTWYGCDETEQFVSGPQVVTVPEGCSRVVVMPVVGSPDGAVRIA